MLDARMLGEHPVDVCDDRLDFVDVAIAQKHMLHDAAICHARMINHHARVEHRIGDIEGFAVESHDTGCAPTDLLHLSHHRSEEHTSELQSLMRHSSAVFCLKKNKII